ncbi:MAG TPA: diaminopimelate decarboxylase, partial [Longimicrobiales bacterium]|nr:diaminopimelate decarboxylase [Longimicrobiales bacterium]
MAREFHHREGQLYCENVPATELVAAHSTPLYVYSRAAVLRRYREFREAFAPAGDPLIAYSVKANGNLAILRLLSGEGAGADIVSGGELHRARLAGIPGERIVFSGVGKTPLEMAAGLAAGIYGFNVESAGELRALGELGLATGQRAPIALRINPDIETPTPHHYTRTGHRASKFGIPSEEVVELYRRAAGHGGLHVRGLSVHIGSQILDVEPYRRALAHVLEILEQLRGHGIEPEYLDLGGGFGVSYEDDQSMEAADFAADLVPMVRESGLRLVLEPGRYVIGAAGLLLTRVLYVKEMGGKMFVVTDAGMNDLL